MQAYNSIHPTYTLILENPFYTSSSTVTYSPASSIYLFGIMSLSNYYLKYIITNANIGSLIYTVKASISTNSFSTSSPSTSSTTVYQSLGFINFPCIESYSHEMPRLDRCYSQCPLQTGYYLISGTLQCLPCALICRTCNNNNPSSCTSCF